MKASLKPLNTLIGIAIMGWLLWASGTAITTNSNVSEWTSIWNMTGIFIAGIIFAGLVDALVLWWKHGRH